MIKIRNLNKIYKQFGDFSIKCAELDISKGDIIGIYGGVGSGKTLLTKILSGIHKKYDGQIEYGMVSLESYQKKLLSYIPSTNVLYDGLTLNDHIKFLASEFKINNNEINAKISWFDQYFKINSDLRRKIFSFSTGELQFIKLFLSLLHSPSILIIDELFTGLGSGDIDIIKSIFTVLSEREVTIIFTSSHLQYIKELTIKENLHIKDGSLDT
ncbi:MAG: ATP-binding cassette domain-containing protein [Candidatus Delongbacteria bacterium]|nr:ATP-binding cassette domain-containing protein [Candidatus Delongbacteria bacterium]